MFYGEGEYTGVMKEDRVSRSAARLVNVSVSNFYHGFEVIYMKLAAHDSYEI